MIASIPEYLRYFNGIRRRTVAYFEPLPDEHLHWAPAPGEFTPIEIICHIGSIQLMDWRVVAGQPFHYPGHGPELGDDKASALAYLAGCLEEGRALLEDLPDDVLHAKHPDINGQPTTAWRFLMAAVEHEVHHRSQLASYYQMLGLEPPQLYGVYMENLPG